MVPKIQQDIELSHAILNYITAAYQGRFAFLNILQQLGFQGVDVQEIEKTRLVLQKARTWVNDLAQQVCLFSVDWKQAETFDAQTALQWLDAMRVESLEVAEAVRQILLDPKTPQNSQHIKFLIAAFGRFAYARDNYVKGFVEHAKTFMLPEMLRQYSELQAEATQDVEATHTYLAAYKNPQQDAKIFLDKLFDDSVGLPGAFRTHAHDSIQLISPFQGGLDFQRAGFSPMDALDWQTAGFAPLFAGYWRAYDFTPSAALQWNDAGFRDAKIAFEWKFHSIDPATASEWAAKNFLPEAALPWIAAGYNPDSALEAINNGQSPPRR